MPDTTALAPVSVKGGRRLVDLALALVVIGLLEVADYHTGPYVSFSLLYLLPVAFVAWRVGRAPAVTVALVAVGFETLVDLAWPQVTGVGVYFWNAFSRASVLVVGAALVSGLRRERDRLHAANELLAAHLAASETRFGLLADTLDGHAIVLFDGEGRARRWNTAALVVTRRAPEQLGGRTLAELFPAAGPGGEPSAPAPYVRADERWTWRADGSRYCAEMHLYRGSAALGGGMLAVVHDSTERRRAEDAVRAARDEAVAVARELETLSHTVAHDLRSPLRTIDGFGAILLEEYGERLDEAGRRHIERMRGAARRMALLIDALLDMSRLTRVPLVRARTDLSATALSVGEDLARSDPGHAVTLVVEPGLVAEADPALVQMLLRHLLENAWKFTAGMEGARVEVGGLPEAATFYVRDNGPGFDMAYVDRLFRPFERLHRPDEYGGTGIGLASVRRIAERHGGRAWAEGRVGGGATIWFSLPSPPAEDRSDAPALGSGTTDASFRR